MGAQGCPQLDMQLNDTAKAEQAMLALRVHEKRYCSAKNMSCTSAQAECRATSVENLKYIYAIYL